MSKNGYLQKRKDVHDALTHAAERVTEQFMEDTLQIALHRIGWGYDRIIRFTEQWMGVRNEYVVALHPSNAEADCAQEHMDREIRDICKKVNFDIYPFYVRYPEIKKIKYDKRG